MDWICADVVGLVQSYRRLLFLVVVCWVVGIERFMSLMLT